MTTKSMSMPCLSPGNLPEHNCIHGEHLPVISPLFSKMVTLNTALSHQQKTLGLRR